MSAHRRSRATTDAEAIFFVILLVVVGVLMMIEPSRVLLIELFSTFLHMIFLAFVSIGSFADHWM